MLRCAALVFAVGCGRIAFDPRGDAAADAEDAFVPLGPFGAPTLVSIPIASAKTNPSMPADGLELYFISYPVNADLYVTTRATRTDPWGVPREISELNSGMDETDPEVTADGLGMYFASNRNGGFEIFYTTRASRQDLWSPPVVVPELSVPGPNYAPAVDATGTRMVLSSGRTGGLGSTDIYLVTRTSTTEAWQAAQPLTSVNSTAEDGTPALARDGLDLVFTSRRPGAQAYDLYEATRLDESAPFDAPVPLAELNTTGGDLGPWLSADGRTLLFDSNHTGQPEIYEATR